MQFFSRFCCGNGFDREQSWRIFSLKELQAATNNFNYDNNLGEGRFGSVYWGQLSDGSQIAVKILKASSSRNKIDFAVEAEILARIRHHNLLSMRGYCLEGQERLIVYEYMPNSSLDFQLHYQHSSDSLLDWSTRMNIALNSAQAIAYLHHRAKPRILHGDVRSSNVLLDSEFEARVTDFGFYKLIPEEEDESDKGDVYRFGVVLLELVSGKRPIERLNKSTKLGIIEWVLPLVYKRRFSEIVDQRLNEEYVEEEVKRVVLVGLMCVQSEFEKRPTMSEVVKMLLNKSKKKMAEFEDKLFNEVIDESSKFTTEEKKDHQKHE